MINLYEEGGLETLFNGSNLGLAPFCQIVDSNGSAFNVSCDGMTMEDGRLYLQMNHPNLICMSREEYERSGKVMSGEHVQIPKSAEQAKAMILVAENYLQHNG